MDKGIYTALSGGIAKNHELELISNNLANANTPGFKRDTGTFNEYLTELRRPDNVEGLKREITAATLLNGRPAGDKSFVEMDGVYTDFTQGHMEKSGRSLDVGLDGAGFFEIYTPSGVRYTRQGNFNLSRDGLLVTSNGFPVLSKGGGKPGENPESRFIRLGEGPIHITEDGIVMQDGQRLAALSIQEFHETQWLEKSGDSYYRNIHPDNLKVDTGHTEIHQGYLESSNVNPVGEMTRLIEATRSYESHMQAIKTYQEIDGRTVADIVRGR